MRRVGRCFYVSKCDCGCFVYSYLTIGRWYVDVRLEILRCVVGFYWSKSDWEDDDDTVD